MAVELETVRVQAQCLALIVVCLAGMQGPLLLQS